jgi:class 3 adenylate cyclase
VKRVLSEIADTQIAKRPPVPSSMPASVSAIMLDCLAPDPSDRPSIDDIAGRIKRVEVKDVTPKENHMDVLSKAFPKHIAEALSEGRKVEPENHECVTIFFSDVVSFATIASELEPRKISHMLQRLFAQFDALADVHGIHKVETIGDAWMGVANCVKDQSTDHAKRVAMLSLDSVRAANETLIDDPSRSYLQIRCGMHSGPVLADVIGTQNPHYSLFGDTVNVASRMESRSEPNMIHSSEASADLLRQQAPDLRLLCRGLNGTKGKGDMVTHWVSRSEDISESKNVSCVNEMLEL